ncbi:MAG TPA: CDP-diacylglycerol--serine O-phosphatidyltransferase [Puia sp.]|jgi:CDP-diacylglycerol--serine O-phosphatidyltransferase|nr:CDP-diacylglycerol--serine O-phosphatidyltransferase [Puia sp.]
MKIIPNLFTLLNLLFGCLAVILILQNGIMALDNSDGTQYIGMPERTQVASAFIGLAALVDFLDGLVARLFKATSPLGRELDSLADVVSFGVAPGMILYQLLRYSWEAQPNGLNVSTGWLLPAMLIPCAAAYRLARFNIDDAQQYGFRGVPTPAAGLLIASLPLIEWYTHNDAVRDALRNRWVLYGLILVVAWLMISNLPLMALKFNNSSVRSNMPKLILLALAVIAAIFLQWLAVPVVFVVYIIVSLAFGSEIRGPKHKNRTT